MGWILSNGAKTKSAAIAKERGTYYRGTRTKVARLSANQAKTHSPHKWGIWQWLTS